MLKPSEIDPTVKAALREDIGNRDITSSALVSKNSAVKADIQFEQRGILCGIEIAERVFRLIDEDIRFLPVAKDGELIEKGREVAYLEGRGGSILTAERTAVNFLSYLSGIATLTREFVDKVKNFRVKILDTRKTTPSLRIFEKYAVRVGGGMNHRLGLYDQVLIKDNHLRILRSEPIESIVTRAKKAVLKKTVIGIEVKNQKELAEALQSKADYILLDNMSVSQVREAFEMRKKLGTKIPLEVSGGVTLENVVAYAETGVERISVGSLTHGAPSIDISLDIVSSA